MIIAIPRTKRPRDAYKVAALEWAAFPEPASEIDLRAYRMTEERNDRYHVHFRLLPGFKRTMVETISPFWDTDLAAALMQWNRENGGSPLWSGCAGSHFYTPCREDAMMMRMAFS